MAPKHKALKLLTVVVDNSKLQLCMGHAGHRAIRGATRGPYVLVGSVTVL